MKKYISTVLTGAILASAGYAYGADIVYPKSNNPTIDKQSTFFVGNEIQGKILKINSQEVKLSPLGGFFYPVDLLLGENIFDIDDGSEVKTYKITRNETSPKEEPNSITMFDNPITVVIIKDNVPLRSIPYDGGITRLQHFDKGIPLNIVGEYEEFYLVKLARDDYAWIDKKSVTEIKGYNNSPANIESYVYEETPSARIYTLKLSKKVPYVLSETRKYETKQYKSFVKISDGLDLVVYNVKGYPENKYEFHINRTSTRDFGYKIYYKNNHELVIKVKNFPVINPEKPLAGIKITLDAGHGGRDPGAIGCLGTKEKNLNLQIVQKLKKQLENQGAVVFLTREADNYVDLDARVKFSQNNNSDIFLSIHSNALPDGSAEKNPTGSYAYYYYDQSALLADKIVDSLTYQTGLKNNGINERSFYVVRNTESPAVLLEVGYIISPEDNEKLLDDKFQDSVVKGIIKGIVRYFNEK